MNVKVLLNFLKWQLIKTKEFNESNLEYYLYLCDLYKKSLWKYVFGSYLITDVQLNDFYSFLSKQFGTGKGWYQFEMTNGDFFKLPEPTIEDRKIYRTELMDLILPYLAGYPNKKSPFHEGPYEYGDIMLKKGDIVFDLGANFGMFSAYASAKECKVYAFEPTVETVEKYLNKTASLNDNINILKLAVSNFDGVQEFTIDKRDNRCNGISETKTNLLKHEEQKILVPVTRLDTFVNDNKIESVNFIKADIEGAERLMLAGAKNVLREFGPDLAICYYHLIDDYHVLRSLILEANPNYEITHDWKKIYARVRKK